MNHNLTPGSEPIKGYTLIDRLGQGGFGEVWKATGPGGFHVALKFVSLVEGVGPVELRALEVIKHIRHPHLLGTFGSWQADDRLIIAMELADRTLLDHLYELNEQGFTGIPAPEIFEYFLEAAKGIDFLNEPRHPTEGGGTQGIQHRDIKPQNLLLIGGSVKVADFGLARVLENSRSGGHSGSMTLSYAPPEAFNAKISQQSDQYSLAVTYCQLRGGRLPFVGPPEVVMFGHLELTPDLSMLPELEREAVARALSKSPGDRWPSCRAFIRAVMAAEGLEVPDTRMPADSAWKVPTQPDSVAAMLPIKPAPLSELAHAPPRRRWISKLGVWATLAAALLVAILLLLPRGKPADVVASVTTERNGTAVRTLIDRGLSFLASEEVEKARADFDEAIRLDPGNAEAHAGRVCTYWGGVQDRKQRLQEAEEALRLNSSSALAHAVHAMVLASGPSPDLSLALTESDESIRLGPNVAICHAIRALVYNRRFGLSKRADDLDQAIAESGSAIHLDPKLTRAYIIRCAARRGRGDVAQAMRDCDFAIQLNPKCADAWAQKGFTWGGSRHPSEAIKAYTKAIQLNPNMAGVYDGRGNDRGAIGDHKGAKEDHDKAARLRSGQKP